MSKISNRPGAIAILAPGIAAIIIVAIAITLVGIDAATRGQDISLHGSSAMQAKGNGVSPPPRG